MSIFLSSTPIRKHLITSTYPQAWKQAFTKRNICSGFKKTGIYPFKPRILLNTLPHQEEQSKPTPPAALAALASPLQHPPQSTPP
jgi:hypothetical protein